MSGPAGGVIGGRAEGILCGRSNLITVDIGGTSADISTIPDGRIKITRVKPADGPKVAAGDWAKAANLAVGARFT